MCVHIIRHNEKSDFSRKTYAHTFWNHKRKREEEREERNRDAKRGRIVQTGKETQPARVRYSLFQHHGLIVRWWIILVDALDLQIILMRNVLNMLTTKRDSLLSDCRVIQYNMEKHKSVFLDFLKGIFLNVENSFVMTRENISTYTSCVYVWVNDIVPMQRILYVTMSIIIKRPSLIIHTLECV